MQRPPQFWRLLRLRLLKRELQWQAGLFAGVTAEVAQQLSAIFRATPIAAIVFVMKAAAFGSQPNLVQRFLQVHHDLAFIQKSQSDYATIALAVDVSVGRVIDAVAALLDVGQQRIG